MFNFLTRNAISSVRVIRKRFSTNNTYPNVPEKIIPEIKDFQYILDNRILHVDKSLIISDIIQSSSVLITRPRRWGKSLTLKMLESFFQPKYSLEGNIINDDEKKEKFSKMLIGSEIFTYNPFTHKIEQTKIIDLQGSLPVITLTFENINEFITKNKIITSLINAFRNSIDQHRYLLTSTKLINKYNQELLKRYFSQEKVNFTENEIAYTLYALIKSLNEHHNKKVIILIDDYDKSLVDIKLNRPDLYKYACGIYNGIFYKIKNNSELLQLSVIMGVTRIAKEWIFSGINHIFHDSINFPVIIDYKKAVHFGFTETEVGQLIKQAKQISSIKLDEDEIKKKLSEFYNGYKIEDKLVYNPYSVMNCLHHLVYDIKPAYKNYSVSTGNPALLIKTVKEHKKYKDKIFNQLMKNCTTIEHKKEYKYEHLPENNIEILIKSGEVDFGPYNGIDLDDIHTDNSSLLTLMLDEGYITSTDIQVVYRIPNTEMRHQFFGSIFDAWFSRKEKSLMRKRIKKNEFEDPKIFIKLFQKRILDNVEYEKYPEFFFQSILYAYVDNDFGALEYKTFNQKQIDIILKSQNDKTTVYIIQIKKKGSDNNEATINKGLEQILEKRYAESIINEYEEFKTIIMRVVYFEMKQFSKWEISMVELKFTRDNLKRAIKCFVPKTDSDETSRKQAKGKDVESKEVERKEVERNEVLNNEDLFKELKKFTISYFPS